MHKFKLWRSVFGYGEGDGDLLRNALLERVGDSRFEEKDSDRGGVRRFEIVIEDFTGPNGNTGSVVTG